uniref:Uncharacterized protein n=1 Tax=Pyrodinium bahamense TaxID=73915 RepID=A0A7S0A2R2_9DINO|mmetsp:Transcript_20144/g.55512  ORF Transcript_20144/g.55512 Transcript_20144/m.55512 type:complete len:850 (+) Transcript_20144:127-2676(+)
MRGTSQNRAAIAVGSRVRVVQGRQFQNFGAGDTGVAVLVDKEAGTCDVAFDGREGRMTVALRYLEADPSGTGKPAVTASGPAPPPPQGVQQRSGRGRAGSNDSSATDPDGREIVWEGDLEHRPGGPPDRPQQRGEPQPGPRPQRCVAEVLRDVRRAREAHRRGALTIQGAAEVCSSEVAAALSEAMQAASSATAAATANAMNEVGCLRTAFSELRELILLEAEQRVAGLREVQDGLEQVRAGQSPDGAGSETLLRAEQRRLEQKQAELVSLCASLQTLKDQHAEHLAPHGGQAAGHGAAVGAPADWELSALLPLTVRLNSLDARLMLLDERLNLLGGQVTAATGGQGQGQGQDQPHHWEQRLQALGARVEALVEGEAQRSACLGQLQAKFAADVEQAQQSLKTETVRLSADLRAATTDALTKVGGDAAVLLKAQADAERERATKLLESLQARLDTLSEGLATEARMREAAVSQVEAQVRRACGESVHLMSSKDLAATANHKSAHLRAASASPTSATNNGFYCSNFPKVAPATDKTVEARPLATERPVEPRAVHTEKYAGQTMASLAGQAAKLQSSADRTLRRLRAELGSSGGSGTATCAGSPRLERHVAGPVQPRTPRPAGQPENDSEAATLTPGSTTTATAAGTVEEASVATAQPVPSNAGQPMPTTRVLRMESSPAGALTARPDARQKSAQQQAAVAAARRGMHAVSMDLNHTGRPDLMISGLDLNREAISESMQHSLPGPGSAPQHMPPALAGALTPGAGLGTGPLAAGPMAGPGPGGPVMQPALMSPSVPMMPLHLAGGSSPAQQGMPPGAAAGGLMWPPVSLPASASSSFGPLAAPPFLQPPRV